MQTIGKYFLVFIMIMFIFSCPAMAEYKIIANKSVNYQEIDSTTLQKIFLGKITVGNKKEKLIPVTLNQEDSLKSFISDNLHMSPKKYSSWWAKAVFTGTGTPPKSFKDTKSLLEYIATTEGAISFVKNEEPLAEDVKQVLFKEE